MSKILSFKAKEEIEDSEERQMMVDAETIALELSDHIVTTYPDMRIESVYVAMLAHIVDYAHTLNADKKDLIDSVSYMYDLEADEVTH